MGGVKWLCVSIGGFFRLLSVSQHPLVKGFVFFIYYNLRPELRLLERDFIVELHDAIDLWDSTTE